MYSAYCNDDTCHFTVKAPHGNIEFPFTVKTRTKWSKNVRTMKNCPDQILMGSDDSKTCVLLWLSVYLEDFLKDYPNAEYLFTPVHGDKAPNNCKAQIRNRLEKVCWSNSEFKALSDETGDEAELGVGTHSNRKYVATLAQRKGADRLQVEYRGRWVGDTGKRVVSRVYINTNDTYTDAFVASLCCKGGAVKYELADGVVVTDNWLFVECVPNIREQYADDSRFCRVMGLCFLWAVFDEETSAYLDPTTVDRIRSNFQRLHGLIEGNPVTKTKLSVVKINGSLDIIPLSDSCARASRSHQGAHEEGGDGHSPAGVADATLGYLQRLERSMTGELQAIRGEQASVRRWLGDQMDRVVTNQRRFGGTIGQAFARQSATRQAQNRQHEAAVNQQRQEGETMAIPAGPPVPQHRARASNRPVRLGINPRAKLAKNLRSLHEFWEEYMFGIGDNKPAKAFTTDEVNGQGASFKNKYSRRMKIWRVQSYLINCGLNIEAANARIVEVYGTDKPTPMMLIIQHDQKKPNYPFVGVQRFHPRLVVNTD